MRLGLFFLVGAGLFAQQSPEAQLRKALAAKTGAVSLPSGEIEISREILIPADAHDLDIRGVGTTIKAAESFRGRALIVFPAGKNIKLHDLTLNGNRDAVARMIGFPPAGTQYSHFMPNNGILAESVTGLEISQILASRIGGFTVLVNAGRNIRIHDLQTTDSGGFTQQRLNNGTGGILIEEGSADFEISNCFFGKMRGNGISLHSVGKGRVFENEFEVASRNAIELAQANDVLIENNHAIQVGYPVEEVDVQGTVLPSAIFVEGASARDTIRNNEFEQISGRCMSLGNLADSEVSGNKCSETLFGGIVLSGSRNKIQGNHLVRLNLSKKNQTGAMSAGVFLDEAARDNAVDNNEISGVGMSRRCVEAPADSNKIAKNDCSDEASVARLLLAIPH